MRIHKQALQQLQHGDWAAAHKLIQDHNDALSCLIHAHLHRIEGDQANAAYWYRRAGKDLSEMALEQEFGQLWRLAE